MPTVKTNKDEIILQAIQIFRKKGYYNTSMSDLAEQCGLQKGSFYHYFPSKEVLMVEVLKTVHAYLKSKAFTIAYDETLEPKERMSKLLLKLGKVLLSQEGGCIAGNTTLETVGQISVFKPILKSIFGDWSQAMQHIFRKIYPENEAQSLAEQAVMEFEGAVMFSLLFDSEQYLKDAYSRTLAKFN
jgi:TetR/AcrR family transcriptional regulator, transcriptional repressor for nem operon